MHHNFHYCFVKRGAKMIHNRFKCFLLYYFIYCLLIISIGVFFGAIVNKNLFKPEPLSLDHDFMFLVLSHNLRNFIMYLLAFIVSPILQLLDFGGSAFQITIGFRTLGTQEALNRLIPHGLLEFPNMLLYQGISQYMLFTLIFTRSIKMTLDVMKKMIPFYLLSLIILIIAAILEGYI
ncbi:stage II sporulation protein M [Bacillus inaquosorum]|uniref:stage II sporulation protein M n=2 Tax=Bacillus inaquosorum TaxID=483913 RepID=UPI002DDC9B5C|nr:stage II sporulation protein M [Bacillus inaquosorum]